MCFIPCPRVAWRIKSEPKVAGEKRWCHLLSPEFYPAPFLGVSVILFKLRFRQTAPEMEVGRPSRRKRGKQNQRRADESNHWMKSPKALLVHLDDRRSAQEHLACPLSQLRFSTSYWHKRLNEVHGFSRDATHRSFRIRLGKQIEAFQVVFQSPWPPRCTSRARATATLWNTPSIWTRQTMHGLRYAIARTVM